MKKRKIVFKAAILVTGIAIVTDRIKLYKKIKNLEERTKSIGRCHNEFCLIQEKYNRRTGEEMSNIKEEIGTVYEHIAALSKGKVEGR